MITVYLIVAALAVTRITRVLTEDKIAHSYRQWITNKWGTESWQAYWAHCPWCTSIWVATPVMPLSLALIHPYPWLIAILAIPAASLIAGLILGRE